MKYTREQIEQMPAGPEINALIEAEIFGAIPLTDEEWELCIATWMMVNGPHSAAQLVRLLKVPLDAPQYETKLMFRLQWPSDYSSDIFGSSNRLINKMRADGWLFSLHDGVNDVGEVYKLAQFVRECKATQEEIKDCKAYRGIITIRGKGLADIDSLAIARAALNAKLALNKRDAVRVTSPHPFKGRVDRDCEICGLPDRDHVHAGQGMDLYKRGEK